MVETSDGWSIYYNSNKHTHQHLCGRGIASEHPIQIIQNYYSYLLLTNNVNILNSKSKL